MLAALPPGHDIIIWPESERTACHVQCCACMGEYQECLGPLMAEGIVEVVLTLLADWRARPVELVDALRLLCALLAHRKCAHSLHNSMWEACAREPV